MEEDANYKSLEIVENNSLIKTKESIENFEFSIDLNDTVFTLVVNNSYYKDNITTVVSKMVIVKELSYVNLNVLSEILANMKIFRLNIFFINKTKEINVISANKGSEVKFIEISPESFITLLNV